MTIAMELQLDDEPRSSLSIEPGFGRCSGISPKFARRFAEGIGKLARNTSGDRRKKIGRLVARMPEAIGLARGKENVIADALLQLSGQAKILAISLPSTDFLKDIREE
ncbi:hypothetical protein BHE74_00037094 [Ensete ventricosum]|nr:hypothetical protein BHE74_00037094 [Ensete ventricosum]